MTTFTSLPKPISTTAVLAAAITTRPSIIWQRRTLSLSSSSSSSPSPSVNTADDADATHDDFKPTRRAPGGDGPSVEDLIRADITSNRVMLFMKGTPEAPQCGFSNHVCRILDTLGVEYQARNVLASEEVREGIKKFSDWPTIPQVYVDGEFIGGCDVVTQMYQSGDLATLLKKEPK